MAHFAELDANNIVLRVIVINNNELIDDNGQESEAKGIAFCQSLYGGTWKQTSYNGSIRKNYAGAGYTYRQDIDAFVAPQPYPSWVLDDDTARWGPPIPYPNDGKYYRWDEATRSWIEVPVP